MGRMKTFARIKLLHPEPFNQRALIAKELACTAVPKCGKTY